MIIVLFVGFLWVFTTCYAQKEEASAGSGKNSSVTQTSRSKYDEVYHAIVSDLVVIGEVVKVEDLPGPSTELFHSEALVKIDSVLRGKANFKILILLRQSGPLSDKGNIRTRWSLDATFKVGERGIYFLHRPERDNYLTSPYIQRGLYSLHRPPEKNDQSHYKTSFYGKQSLSELPDSVFWGDHVCRDGIINGMIRYPWGTETVDTVAKEIRNLSPVINH